MPLELGPAGEAQAAVEARFEEGEQRRAAVVDCLRGELADPGDLEV